VRYLARPATMGSMVFYGVLDRRIGDIIEFFRSRGEAERFIAECLADEPDWHDLLSVEAVEFMTSSN
jgi:hypothetical protein